MKFERENKYSIKTELKSFKKNFRLHEIFGYLIEIYNDLSTKTIELFGMEPSNLITQKIDLESNETKFPQIIQISEKEVRDFLAKNVIEESKSLFFLEEFLTKKIRENTFFNLEIKIPDIKASEIQINKKDLQVVTKQLDNKKISIEKKEKIIQELIESRILLNCAYFLRVLIEHIAANPTENSNDPKKTIVSFLSKDNKSEAKLNEIPFFEGLYSQIQKCPSFSSFLMEDLIDLHQSLLSYIEDPIQSIDSHFKERIIGELRIDIETLFENLDSYSQKFLLNSLHQLISQLQNCDPNDLIFDYLSNKIEFDNLSRFESFQNLKLKLKFVIELYQICKSKSERIEENKN
ncbi:hypothetical protein M0811_11861 [Anaeramoeba ignava]|uniref:Uncharacterized protein n=1 Tax=Anaeramoeba ignava TaxID=1746090 RepID=A0A9Q0LBW8_ANAIG|nr:hypothetical protein M0811_11861 [Anaeramoeba ignava]